MGKKKREAHAEIDGQLFGRNLFSLATTINLADKKYGLSKTQIGRYRNILNQISKSKALKMRWERLWKWRAISNKQGNIEAFFQHQCLLRNQDVPNCHFVNEYPFVNEHPQLYTELAPEGFYNCYWKMPIAVTEIFNCTKEKQTTVLRRDLEIVRTDKDYHIPVIYLRIDLRAWKNLDSATIENLIQKKTKLYGVKKIGRSSGKVIEMALMIHDLKELDLKLQKKDILNLIKWAVEKPCNKYYVKDKLVFAKKLVKHSKEKVFPPKTTSKK
ncbi:MAG: hypothetical protein Q8M71_13415 [Thermodesulfovibrionales bacterium]|nr:hypothetical protein [Thermodesulfovibrionales bacterium]